MLEELKSGCTRIIRWNKYLLKPEILTKNPNLNHLVQPSLQGVNRLFVLAFENDTQRTNAEDYYLPNVELKDYNIMIKGENVNNNKKITQENIRKIATGQEDDYTTGCMLDYPYFKDSYKMDADPRANQQINFTANLDRAGNTRIYFILEEARETKLDFSQGTVL